jgi:hypothetical protein
MTRASQDTSTSVVVLCGIPYIHFPQHLPSIEPLRQYLMPSFSYFNPTASSCRLAMMSALIFQQSSLLSGEVYAERDRRDAEAGEGALEAVEAGEGARVSPLLTTNV